MRRTHLRKHGNILKRQLIHVGAFHLSLIFRRLLGAGTPREWKNRGGMLFLFLLGLFAGRKDQPRPCRRPSRERRAIRAAAPSLRDHPRSCRRIAIYTTKC
jgi:hypothetical protein